MCDKGVDKFKALISNQALPHISSMLLGVGEDCDSSFERLYDKLFDKEGKEKEFLTSFTSIGITLGNVSSMLSGAGNNAPEALDRLLNKLNDEITEGKYNGKTYLYFLLEKNIMSNVSSMLHGAGNNAPEYLEKLCKFLLNGKLLQQCKDTDLNLKNLSSMLSRAGNKAPEALKELCDALNKKITEGEYKGKTYLKVFLQQNSLDKVIGKLKKQKSSNYENCLKLLIDDINASLLNNTSSVQLPNQKKSARKYSKKNRVNTGVSPENNEEESDARNKKSKKQEISPQQSNSSSHKKKAEEIGIPQWGYSLRKRLSSNTQIHSVYYGEERQEVFTSLLEFTSNNFPGASIKSVRQGLHLPSFEARGVKIDGKCTSVTCGLSQALSLQNSKSFLGNLKTSAKIYERIAQGRQISKREEGEVFAFSKLLNNFERQLDSATNSLPSSLIHTQGYKTFSGLSNYIAGVNGDFAIHLVTSNHVVAIYRTGDNYAYFDSNAAFVFGLKSVDQLMQVVEKAVEFAGYKVEGKGFLVEHFDVEQANKLLSNEDKEVLTKEIKTERQLLAEQDKELGLIKVNGLELSRVQLYDFGTKIHVEGSVPLLINANMNLSSKKFQDHLDKKEVSMTAREYLDSLKNSKNAEEATKFIPFIGSKREVEKAEQTRKPLLEQLAKGTINSILAAVSLSLSWSKSQLPEKTDEKPKTCLNDPTVDRQLQRSL